MINNPNRENQKTHTKQGNTKKHIKRVHTRENVIRELLEKTGLDLDDPRFRRLLPF